MNGCVICGDKVNAFSKKTLEGKICKACSQYLPCFIHAESYDTESLEKIIKERQENFKKIEITASYGDLHIDSLNNLFCVSKKVKGDKPASMGDIYSVTKLTGFGLYCTDIRNVGQNTNKVICNVKVRIKTENLNGELTVKSGTPCNYTIVGDKIECREPPDLSMFRAMFVQMIDNEVLNTQKKLEFIAQN